MRCGRHIAIVLALAWSGSARAQSERELATRRDLITQAEDFSAQGKHAEAVALAKRAAAIKMTPSLRLFLAREESAVGLLADAYGNARQCDAEAEANDRLGGRERILSECKEIEKSLGNRVGRITVKLPIPTPPNVHVTVAGEEVNAALLGEPYVVSPGKIAIVAVATGYLPFTSQLDIGEGATSEIDVELAPDPSAESCPKGQERLRDACVPLCADGKVRTTDEAAECCWPGQTWSVSAAACSGVPQCSRGRVARGEDCVAASPFPAPQRGPSSLTIWSLSLGGAGIVGLGMGSVFGLMALSSWNTAKSLCPVFDGSLRCSSQGARDRDSALTFGTSSTVAFIAGAALFTGGVTLYFIARKHSPYSSSGVGVAIDPDGLTMTGRF